MSYIYKIIFILAIVLILGYTLFLIVNKLKLSKVYKYLAMFFTLSMGGVMLFLMFINVPSALESRNDSVDYQNGRYYAHHDEQHYNYYNNQQSDDYETGYYSHHKEYNEQNCSYNCGYEHYSNCNGYGHHAQNHGRGNCRR